MTNPSRRIPAPRPHSLEVDARYVLLARWAKGRNVLDMGGASCRALALLVNAGVRKLVVATDAPDALRRELQGAGLDGVEVVAAAAASTPFVDQAFDLVVFHDFAAQERASGMAPRNPSDFGSRRIIRFDVAERERPLPERVGADAVFSRQDIRRAVCAP
jgi:hypothetical protein